MTNNLEINILYWSSKGREVPFRFIINHTDTMDFDDYEAKTFWHLIGGFEVTLEGCKTIFHSSDFHYLVKATSFLIHSMYWIKGKESDWFDKDDTYPNDVIIKSTSNNLISLTNLSPEELSFSYTTNKENEIHNRGDRFFKNIRLNKQEWYEASNKALEEYFEILKQIADKQHDDPTSKIMMKYYRIWKNI